MVIVELIKFYIRGNLSDYIIVPMGEEVDSIFRVIDLVNNRDGMDHLIEIEKLYLTIRFLIYLIYLN